ncbi:hypothetical protein Y032_0006g3105 [Ancylostoma ceylanicum]|uniref:Uncharacterized protein n=1 Tax=Ancylostoma ceylanicum TaxID=53326 RepID=A0A016VQ13_9BILA|nr:hypothetical protein Y032_0006g3105 [Ancylostoma ceylanicum]
MTESGNGVLQISSLLNVPHLKFSKALKHFQETGTNGDRPERGRPRTANTRKKFTVELKGSRELKLTRIMARAIGISRESVRMIIRKAGLKAH